jgi:hypothetical protein
MKARIDSNAGRLIVILVFDDNDPTETALRKTLEAQAEGTRYEIATGGGLYSSVTNQSTSNLEVRPVVPKKWRDWVNI